MNAQRITKRAWYSRGGFANPKLFRKGTPSGGWTYWRTYD